MNERNVPDASPMAVFDLAVSLAQLRAEETWRTGDRNASTLFKGEGLRLVLVAMRDNTRIPSHRAACPLSLHVVEGSVRFNADVQSVTLKPGQVMTLGPGIRHDIEALETSAFLLTLAAGQAHPAEPARRASHSAVPHA